MKQQLKLSKREIEFIEKAMLEENISLINQHLLRKIQKELGLNRLQLARRSTKSNKSYKIGYTWNEINDSSPGKVWVSLRCKVCENEYIALNRKIRARTYSDDPLCASHYMKLVSSSQVWKEKNRRAQLIAQNRPETKEKNRISQLRRHAQPGMKEKYRQIGIDQWKNDEYRQKVTLSLKKKWEDPVYARKVFNNSKRQYHGAHEGIKYDSLVELSFILLMIDEQRTIIRYNLNAIKWGKGNNYYPDFIVDGNLIIEIKGSMKGYMNKKEKEILQKQKALANWCENTKYNQRIVLKKDIPKEFYKKAKEIHVKNNL